MYHSLNSWCQKFWLDISPGAIVLVYDIYLLTLAKTPSHNDINVSVLIDLHIWGQLYNSSDSIQCLCGGNLAITEMSDFHLLSLSKLNLLVKNGFLKSEVSIHRYWPSPGLRCCWVFITAKNLLKVYNIWVCIYYPDYITNLYWHLADVAATNKTSSTSFFILFWWTRFWEMTSTVIHESKIYCKRIFLLCCHILFCGCFGWETNMSGIPGVVFWPPLGKHLPVHYFWASHSHRGTLTDTRTHFFLVFK